MKSGIPLIAALLLSTCGTAWSETNSIGQIVLLDVQGLWGGTDLWVSEDGKAVCRFVKPPQKGESGLQEIRYAFQLSKEQDATLSKLVKKHDFFKLKTVDRLGFPDEARPAIFIKSAERAHAVAKWANDKHRDFDPIYEFLVEVAESGKKGTETKKGPVELGWSPDGFPKNTTIWSKTRPAPDKK